MTARTFYSEVCNDLRNGADAPKNYVTTTQIGVWKARKSDVLRGVSKCFASFCSFTGLLDDRLFKCPVTKTIFKDAALVDPLLGVFEEVF